MNTDKYNNDIITIIKTIDMIFVILKSIKKRILTIEEKQNKQNNRRITKI